MWQILIRLHTLSQESRHDLEKRVSLHSNRGCRLLFQLMVHVHTAMYLHALNLVLELRKRYLKDRR